MRVLLAIHNAYTDRTSGAAHSMRTLMEWLGDAGHDCRVLATARFDLDEPRNINAHLNGLGVALKRHPPPKRFTKFLRGKGRRGRGLGYVEFELNGISVTMLPTRHNNRQQPNRREAEQYIFHFEEIREAAPPDLVICYGDHPVIGEVLRRSWTSGIKTLFRLANYGYERRDYFEHVDHVLVPSPFLARYYRDTVGIECTGIPSPLNYRDIVAPTEDRAFVTFVNPSPQKGVGLFARLADMLGSMRPDIPVLVVQSATDATLLNSIPGIDFSKYPQILASEPVAQPADFFALTRIILVPSVFNEPFGRVAAEALINGVPALVSDRGALPDTVGDAGTALPLPSWLTPESDRIVDVGEAQPWFDAVCGLWDDEAAYAAASARARSVAGDLYDEAALRRRYAEFIAGL
jgi:glycosyltransferase involved in cell wall biosynthesis